MYRYLSRDADMERLRVRQDAYFGQFNPKTYSTVAGMLSAGDEHHQFILTPILEQVTTVQGQYLSALRSAYDDRKYLCNGPDSVMDMPVDLSILNSSPSPLPPSSSSSLSPSPTGPSVTGTSTLSVSIGAASQLTNFQQKIDVTPLQQLTAMGDITQQNEAPDGEQQQQRTGQYNALHMEMMMIQACVIFVLTLAFPLTFSVLVPLV